MPLSAKNLENYLNTLDAVENNHQAVNQHFSAFFGKQGLDIENRSIKLKLVAQLINHLYMKALEQIPEDDENYNRQIITNHLDAFTAVTLNSKEVTLQDIVHAINKFNTLNPIQTLNEAYSAAETIYADVIQKLILVSHLYSSLCGVEFVDNTPIDQHAQFAKYFAPSEKERVKAKLLSMNDDGYDYYMSRVDSRKSIHGVTMNRRITRLFDYTLVQPVINGFYTKSNKHWFSNQEECNEWLKEIQALRKQSDTYLFTALSSRSALERSSPLLIDENTVKSSIDNTIDIQTLNEKITQLLTRIGFVDERDAMEANYFIKHHALLHLIFSKINAGILPENNEIISKLIVSTKFTLKRAKQVNPSMNRLEKALQDSDILAVMAQYIEQTDNSEIKKYRELKIKEIVTHSVDMSTQYQNYVSERRALENQYTLLREWSDIKQVIESQAPYQSTEQATSSSSSASSDEKVTVYFRIPLVDANSHYRQNYILYLPHLAENQTTESFVANFNFQKLAEVITCNSLQGPQPIGRSEYETIAIENLHNHYYYRLIVGVQIDKNALSQFRMNKKERTPNKLNIHSREKFYYLEQPVACQVSDIVSVQVMDEMSYRNSMRIRNTFLGQIWPVDLTRFENPNSNIIQQNVQEAKPIAAASATGIGFFAPLQQTTQYAINNIRKTMLGSN